MIPICKIIKSLKIHILNKTKFSKAMSIKPMQTSGSKAKCNGNKPKQKKKKREKPH